MGYISDKTLGPFDLYTAADKTNVFHRCAGVTTDAVKLMYPLYNSPRILAQGGIFTFHTNPAKELDSYNGEVFQHDRLDIECLFRWTIPPGDPKRNIVSELEDLGINRRTVYPDLEGLAKGLQETEIMRSGT
jgi:hypothetical protein